MKKAGVRASERRSNFAADVARLAHARHDDASRGIQAQAASGDKCIVEPGTQTVDGASLNLEHFASQRE
jgi:hypothetical protein